MITTTLVLLIAIWTFGSAFTAIFILTEGGPGGVTETLVLRTYLEAFKYFRPGTAAAMGMIVVHLLDVHAPPASTLPRKEGLRWVLGSK